MTYLKRLSIDISGADQNSCSFLGQYIAEVLTEQGFSSIELSGNTTPEAQELFQEYKILNQLSPYGDLSIRQWNEMRESEGLEPAINTDLFDDDPVIYIAADDDPVDLHYGDPELELARA